MTADAEAAEQPVTAFVFGGVWKKSAMAAFGEPFTKEDRHPGCLPGSLHVREAARDA